MRLIRHALFLLLMLPVLVGGQSAPASAAELLMFETRSCPWCLRWKQEVGVAYPKTPEGQRAPVRSIDLYASLPAGVLLAKPVQFSPTFVLIDDDGSEVGRITGYPGADFFWGLFGELVHKLPPKPAG
ncbi:MAG: thioredoxin family protein [Bosea sp. (in: a-proteobacteria)]